MRGKKTKTAEDMLFYTGLAAGGLLALLWPVFLKAAPYLSGGCRFLAVTGFYCPACGGTRAFSAILHGRLLQAVCLNAAVPYAVLMYVLFMGSQAAERLSRGRIKIGLKYKNVYVYIGIAVMLLQWAVKNINGLAGV